VKEKRAWFYLKVLCVVLVTLALPLQGVTTGPSGETYKQNEQGLEKEFEAFLKAYHNGDDKGMDAAFGVFRMPNAKEWFASHFSAEDAAQLSAAYDRQVADAQTSLIEDMNLAGPGNKFHLRCEARGDVAAASGKRDSDGIQPLKPIRVEQFVMEFQASDTRQKFLFMANFVYEGGAYRYVGGGGAPFWAKM
jgi:hypothetical protein